MTHTQEPWRVSNICPWEVYGPDRTRVADTSADKVLNDELDEENARRIVACVNACAGIDDPAAMRRQRDELAKALEVVVAAWDNADWLDGNQFEEFRAILAQAKGGQN